MTERVADGIDRIAVVGMACRFPGAESVEAFWRNLVDGVESVRVLGEDELLASGVDADLVNDPRYVRAKGLLDGADRFDAGLFGYAPREAALTDPQHRVLLECAWEALERAGYGAAPPDRRVGVYAGVGLNTYLLRLVARHPRIIETEGEHQILIASDKDFAPTRISYHLGLTGPSVNVQTGCSTSLVAVHMACQSLLTHQCDLALAGGAAITVPLAHGYLYREGGILSPDGHCRAFDARAAGTVVGNGVGLVVLKRLVDARADGDVVHAVIAGSAVNNDGSRKVGYTAPSVPGQTSVIVEAQIMAGIGPEAIGYVEAHGTGTALGDPIEVAALTDAFRRGTRKVAYCALGSVKSNIGHLDTAAGIAGLIKAVLAVEHGLIPASLHVSEVSPQLSLEGGPFYVNTAPRRWPSAPGEPRRAGVSSFGIGGTNAHAVVEEAPARSASGASRPWQVLLVSARTEDALAVVSSRLAERLGAEPAPALADVAYTLGCGRRSLASRRAVVCEGPADAIAGLRGDGGWTFRNSGPLRERRAAWMFPGQGAQWVGMARELHQTDVVFREAFDEGVELLRRALGRDLREVLHGPAGEDAEHELASTANAQASLFAVEYGLARTWMAWGVRPETVIGHSVGEYAAAWAAGVMKLEDAARLVAARGRLMEALPRGAMLAVAMREGELARLLPDGASLAAVNGTARCVVSGPEDTVTEIERRLTTLGVEHRRLRTSHAFHSGMMDPMLGAFRAELAGTELRAPAIGWVSGMTGRWLSPDEATDPDYWVRQLREPVRFGDGARTLLADPERVLLEVGPGGTLTALVRAEGGGDRVVASLAVPRGESEARQLAGAVARLWVLGVEIDWRGYYARERRNRVVLPTYPFERQRYWLEPLAAGAASRDAGAASRDAGAASRDAGANATAGPAHGTPSLWIPTWKRSTARVSGRRTETERWLVFVDEQGLGAELARRARRAGDAVVEVEPGREFRALGNGRYTIDPARRDDYDRLVRALRDTAGVPRRVLHLWGVDGNRSRATGEELERGYGSILALGHALVRHGGGQRVGVTVVTDGMHEVTGAERVRPEKAAVLGPVQVLTQEHPEIRCRSVDLEPAETAAVEWIERECRAEDDARVVAYRGKHRWVRIFEPATAADDADVERPVLRREGVYLITGGLGGLGLTLAGHLHRTVGARLVLTARTPLPPRSEWKSLVDRSDARITIEIGEVAETREPLAALVDGRLIREIDTALEAELGLTPIGENAELARLLDDLCASHVHEYLAASGVDTRAGARHSRRDLERRLSIVPAYARFLDFFLRVLRDDGILTWHEGDVVFVRDGMRTSEALRGEATRRDPQLAPVLEFLAYCAGHYRDALSGRIEGLAVLYPDGGSALLEQAVARMSAYARTRQYVLLVRELLDRFTRQRPEPPLRILEVGAGNGFLAREVASRLRERNVEYWFTDIGRSFVDRARRWAASEGIDVLRYGVLDASKDPIRQGYLDPFDVVLALDVVHATPNVGETIGHVRRLLRPGGVLYLLETVAAARCAMMMWGLAKDWWGFADELRAETPLLGIDAWHRVLDGAGFTAIGSRPEEAHRRATADCAMLFARKPAPGLADGDVDERTLERIRALVELEDAGAEVLVLTADVTDAEQMRSVVAQARERFGALDGVIHAAGIQRSGPVEVRDTGADGEGLAAKLRGTRVLEAVLDGQPLDFLLLCSSVTAVLGGVGDVEYAAANAFLDAFAHRRAREGARVVSVDWDRWKGVGLAGAFEARHRARTGQEPRGGMTSAQGCAVFDRILSLADVPQVVVSTTDFESERMRAERHEVSAPEGRAVTGSWHRRPNLGTSFVAPRNDLEEGVAGVWRDTLGIQDVGVDDDFSELGGDSLIAITVVSRLREALGVELRVAALFEAPTVARLAERIEIIRWAAASARSGPAPDTADVEEGRL